MLILYSGLGILVGTPFWYTFIFWGLFMVGTLGGARIAGESMLYGYPYAWIEESEFNMRTGVDHLARGTLRAMDAKGMAGFGPAVTGPKGISPVTDANANFYVTQPWFTMRPLRSTPFDTFEAVKPSLGNLEKQLRFIYCYIHTIANIPLREEIINRDGDPWEGVGAKFSYRGGPYGTHPGTSFTRLTGRVAMWNASRAWYQPVPNALVVVQGVQDVEPEYGKQPPFITQADENGEFVVYGVVPMGLFSPEWGPIWRGYVVNETGSITYGPDRGMHSTRLVYAPASSPLEDMGILTVFPCGSIALFDTVQIETLKSWPDYGYSAFASVYDFASHSGVESFGPPTSKWASDIV